MKRIALAGAIALALGGTASADVFDYAKLFGGVTMEPPLDSPAPNDMQTGLNAGGALGWNFSPEVSAEVEGFFTQSQYDGTDAALETFSFMANAYWSFDCGGKWRPYIGAGIGGVQVTATDNHVIPGTTIIGDSDIVFGYQAMAGVTIPVADSIDFLAQYRYQAADDADLTLTFSPAGGTVSYSQEYRSHNLSAGFRFNL